MKDILYIEDSSMSQLLMRRYVGDAGALTICSTLRSAITRLQEHHFDLLITDYMFPEGDSLDLIIGVRHKFSAEELPIIVVSGSMDRLLLSCVLKAGANDGFPKPLKTVEFNEAVNRMLTQPYVRSPEHGAIDVRCFQWMNNGVHHQFCPDLALTCSGSSREEAAAKMQSLLEASLSERKLLGGASHLGIASHIVELP